ncbi:MAG: LacI family DNA-binding transcriptional regulator, partial [Pseudomonadota bacterium]
MVNSPQRPKAPEAQARPSSGRRRRATSYDVARLAGVSQSAVSRCFKPGASVSKAMRSKVMRAAETLHYRPNAIARGLITQRSHLIAVLVSGRLNFDYPEVLFRLTEALSARGLRVLLFTVDSEADAEGVIEQAWQFQVDGVISASHLSRRQYETLTQRQVPVVFFNRYFTNMPTDIVYCDPARQVGELVERLVGLGHSRFALIRGPKANMVSQERERLVEAALADQNVNGPAAFFGDFSYESGALAADALLTGSEPPTAIICA